MKKVSKRILTFILCVFVAVCAILTVHLSLITILSVSSCSNSALFIDPSEYRVASYNIVWTDCNRKIKKEFIINKLSSKVYYRIENVPVDEYIACRWRDSGLGADEFPVLMKHKDYEGDLEPDTTLAKLYLGDPNNAADDWLKYGQRLMKTEVAQIDKLVAEDIINGINTKPLKYDDIPQLVDDYTSIRSHSPLRNDNGDFLYLSLPVKGYDNLFWMASLRKYGDKYFVFVKDGLHSESITLCNDEFASVIEAVIEAHGLY